MSSDEDLEKLTHLYASGALTREEFEAAKGRLDQHPSPTQLPDSNASRLPTDTTLAPAPGTAGPLAETDPVVLQRLKQFSDRVNSRCLECGYAGLIGVVSRPQAAKAAMGAVAAILVWLMLLNDVGVSLQMRDAVGYAIMAGGLGWALTGTFVKPLLKCPSCEQLIR